MPLINSLLVRSSAGWSERTDAGSITANTRFEAYLALGAAQTEDGVNAYADAQLDIYAIPREEVTAGIAPISTVDLPYVGYRVGDTVTVPNSAGAPTVQRVRGITVTENADTGIAVYTPTFKDLILERAEQIEVAIKKMSNGTLAGSTQVAQPIRQQFFPREVTLDPSAVGLPFVVVADDGSGDYLSIKDAIEDTTETVSGDVGGRFIWVKPHSTGGVYDDGGAGDVDTNSRNFYVFSPSGAESGRPLTQNNGLTEWQLDGFTNGSATAMAAFEGLFLSLQGTSGNRLLNESAAGSPSYLFRRCQFQGAGAIVLSGISGRGFFYECNVALPVFRGAVTYGASLVFVDCTDVNFSPSGAAVTITGDITLHVRNSLITWQPLVIVGAAGNTNGELILEDCALTTGIGGSDLTVSDLQNVFVSGVVDNYLGGTPSDFGTWTFSSSGTTARARSIQFSDNSLRFIGLVFDGGLTNMRVRVDGTYRFFETGVSWTVANVVLPSGNSAGAVIYVTINDLCTSCNIQAAIDGNNAGVPVAGSQAYDIVAGAENHILSVSGYASCGTASNPAPGAGPPTVEVNGTHVLTITN